MDMDSSSSSSDVEDIPSVTHAEHKQNGNEAYKRKDYRSAIANYTLAIETAKENQENEDNDDPTEKCDPETLASYYNNRAASFTMLLQFSEAVADCDEAITLHPPFLKAYLRKAKAQLSLGELEKSLATLNRAAVYDPNSSTIISLKNDVQKLEQRVELAKSLLGKKDAKRGDYPPFPLPNLRDGKQALNQITVVIASCPAWRSILLEKTQALLAAGMTNEAYTTTTSLIRSGNHHNPLLVLYRAYALQQMGNIEGAMQHIRQILSSDPDNKMAFSFHKQLKNLSKKKAEADAHYKGKNYEQAVNAYSEALEMTGCVGQYKAKVYFNRACCNANLRQHAAVVKDCTNAIALDDEYVKAILRRAGSYLLMGEEADCQNAMNDYQTVMDLAEKRGDTAQTSEMKKKIQEAQVQLKRSKQVDFYKVLGVARDATESEIKKSYRKSALKWHPDRHANSSDEEKKKAEKIFRDINHAYEVLGDATKKAKYDSGVDIEDLDNPHAGRGGHGGMGGHGPGGIDPNILFEMFMRGQGGGGMGGGGFHFG